MYPRGSPVGALARHLARRTGLGRHLVARGNAVRTVTLPDWSSVREAFDAEAPPGWAGRYRQAELHELRWAGGPGRPAATALVLAQLDGTLAEVVPVRGSDGGGDTVVEQGA